MAKQKDHILFNDPFKPFMEYHRSYLWNFLTVFRKWDGFPDSVDMRVFNDNLISKGWASILNYPNAGYLTLDGAASGVDRYYRPIKFETTNPVLKSIKREISYKDNVKPDGVCICYNTLNVKTPQPMTDLVEVYAYKLAQADVSTVVSLANSRATLIPAVSDKEDAERVTQVLKDIYAGKPASFSFKSSFDNSNSFNIIPIKARDNLITAELTDTKRQIMAEFLTRLGINVTSVDKKERVLEAEATANKQELKLNSKIYLEPCKIFCEECNATFGWNCSVSIDGEVIEEALSYGESERQNVVDIESDTRADIRN